MTWEQIKSPKKPMVSIDGYQRTPEVEKELNELVASVFKDENGKRELAYLKSITTEAVAGSEITSNALFHLEGRRFLVGIIQQRINANNRSK